MQLEHTFTVPAPIDQAWPVLLDIERIAPCMPGAAIDSVDGDDFTGTVKVRLGPIGLTYKGKARFASKDEAAHRAVIEAQGRDARGNGTASATVTATLTETEPGQTEVTVTTDLNITGKPAQFGRGVMVDVGNKLIGQFADCLAGKLAGPDSSAAAGPEPAAPDAGTPGRSESDAVVPADAPATEQPTPAAAARAEAAELSASGDAPAPDHAADAPSEVRPSGARPRAAEVEPIDLLGSAGPAVLKRLAPPLAAVAAVILFAVLHRRRRH